MCQVEPKVWRVLDSDGVSHEIVAHFCFNNNDDGRGLVFRRYVDDDKRNRADVVVTFAPGYWNKYEAVSNG